MMSLNFALNLISIVFMYKYAWNVSSSLNFCIYIFVHIFYLKIFEMESK